MSYTPARYAQTVTVKVLTLLGDSGMAMPETVVTAMVRARITEYAEEEGCSERVAVKHFPEPDDYAFDLASTILAEIAEERPGTDPFSHPGNIPITVVAVATLLANTQCLTQIGLSSDVPAEEVRPLVHAGVELAAWFSAELAEMMDIDDRNLNPILHIPQPGLAFVLRINDAALHEVLEGRWRPAGISATDVEELAVSIFDFNAAVREVKDRFGAPFRFDEG